MKYPIPDAALEQHTAVLGKTGAGKTSTGKTIVEHLVSQGARVCILDPIKSDWWGLTSSVDGKKAGLPFHILGGPRGHVPLHASSGKAIAEIVANGDLPLSIIDMADFVPGGQSKFFIDFAPVLLRKMRGVVHLVMEEAHLFAPKERSGVGDENMAIHWAKMLATAGRSKGIRLILLTQRTQALHNALLGSCETMIAHRLTAPADQKPLTDWLKANVQKDIVDQVSNTLSSLKTGTAWVCSGEAKFFELTEFPRITTYDNSATPAAGDKGDRDIRMAPVDVDKLRAIVGDAAAEVLANDPKLLKAQIVELQKQVENASKVNGKSYTVDPQALAEADKRGFERGLAQGFASGQADMWRSAVRAMKDVRAFHENPPPGAKEDAVSTPDPQPSSTPAIPAKKVSKAPPVVLPPREVLEGSSITGPQMKLLETLAWWNAYGHTAPTRIQIAAKAGWTPKGSNLRNRLSELSQAGLVEYPRPGVVLLSSTGLAAAPAPNTSETLLDAVRGALTGPQQQLFDTLIQTGVEMARVELAAALGWEPGGSNLRNRLSELSQLEIVTYPRPGVVALQAWVHA